MNALSELSGPLATSILPEWPPASSPKSNPFPGNAANGLFQYASVLIGGCESSVPAKHISGSSGIRKPPQREQYFYDVLSHGQILLGAGDKHFEDDLELLRSQYVFRNGPVINRFLFGHRIVVPTLSAATSRLKESFGQDMILTLEATVEDDESISLYGIVIWRGSAAAAELALEDFDQRWGLNQTPHPGLTFTYELA